MNNIWITTEGGCRFRKPRGGKSAGGLLRLDKVNHSQYKRGSEREVMQSVLLGKKAGCAKLGFCRCQT